RARAEGSDMSEDASGAEPAAPAVSQAQLQKAEAYVEAEEGVVNRLFGWAGRLVTSIAVAMSLFHLYAAVAGAWPFTDFPIIATQPLRYAHVAFVLMLSFLLFPLSARFRDRIRWWDIAAGIVGAAILVYAIEGGEEFTDRATMPTHLDVVLGVVFIILLLEATRRTTGWIVPCVALSFMAYAMAGPCLPPPWTHRGYDISQLVGHLFITLDVLFVIPVDVFSSLIILFTIYGAFLQHSGAGKFFIDFSMALMGHKANSAGRTVVLSSFLLGGPSGSGVATTVTIGAVAYPLMQKGGFREERGRRAARGGRPRRHHLSAGPGRRRLPDRRVPEDQLPRRDLDGDHPDLPLLPVALVHGGARRQAVRRAHRGFPAGIDAVGDDAALWLSLRLARFDHHLHAVGLLPDAARCRLKLPPREPRDHAEELGAAVPPRLDHRAPRRNHLRDGRHHRRRGHVDRAGAQVLLDRDRLRRREPAADRDLHRADRLDRRLGGAGDRLLHHLRGHRGARHDQAGRARLRRPHVHLLPLAAVGGLAPHRAVAVPSLRH